MAAAIPMVLGGLIGGATSMLMKPKAPKQAAADAPRVMPLADDEAVAAAKRRSMMMQTQRGGRSSTMLTSDTETLGG